METASRDLDHDPHDPIVPNPPRRHTGSPPRQGLPTVRSKERSGNRRDGEATSRSPPAAVPGRVSRILHPFHPKTSPPIHGNKPLTQRTDQQQPRAKQEPNRAVPTFGRRRRLRSPRRRRRRGTGPSGPGPPQLAVATDSPSLPRDPALTLLQSRTTVREEARAKERCPVYCAASAAVAPHL